MNRETQKGLQCCSERHLLKSALAIAVYNKIGAITKGGKDGATYFATLEPLADLFGADPNSIWRVVTWLCLEGFLEKLATTNGKPSQLRAETFLSKNYRYVSHEEWAGKNPGKCYEALDPNWELGDELARAMWKASQGNTRWYAGMLACLRSPGWGEQRIVQEWKEHLQQLEKPPVYRGQWKSAQGTFLRKVKQLAESNAGTPALK